MAVANLPKYAAGSQPFTVLIEGNIGSGKTTFLNHFKKFQNICLLTEPVEKWRNLNGVNIFVIFVFTYEFHKLKLVFSGINVQKSSTLGYAFSNLCYAYYATKSHFADK